MFIQIINYIKFLIKEILNPFLTIIKYPHVKLVNGVVLVNCKIDEFVIIYGKTTINNTSIAAYSYVGGNSKIMNTTIGKFCSIGPNVKIGLGIHPTEYISTYPGFYSSKASGVYKINRDENVVEHKSVNIKNDVWIGDSVTIVDGITIGNGAVIAAGSVVTKDIPDYAIVGGIPAKTIKNRFNEAEVQQLLKIKWWEKDILFLKENGKLFLEPKKFFKHF